LFPEDYKHDVYLSYAGESKPWVHNHLAPFMENELGLKLCIHERDFTPGRQILDNVVENLTHSKKILLIFSR
jgi:hypothetical protein